MRCMSQNFRLFHVSNLSVRNFRIFSAHVYGDTDTLQRTNLPDPSNAAANAAIAGPRRTCPVDLRRPILTSLMRADPTFIADE